MIFRRTPQFKDDFELLEENQKTAVKEAFPRFQKAIQGESRERNEFRIRKMVGWPGIYEAHIKQNICFTFEIIKEEGKEDILFFRRIGTHDIYNNP